MPGRASRPARRGAALTTLSLLALLAAGPALALQEKPWLHVQVLDESDATRVSVNLPLGAVEVLAESMGDRILEQAYDFTDDHGEADVDVELEDVRVFWKALRDEPGAWVEVDSEGGDGLRARMDGDEVRIEGTGEDGGLSIRFPAAVGDALFGGPEGSLDFGAAIRSLAAHEGDVVSVSGDDAEVRIWIAPQ